MAGNDDPINQDSGQTVVAISIPNPQLNDLNISSPEICVICLERISGKASCISCGHDQFDFACLGTWLHHQQVCPLCKGVVHAIRYVDDDSTSHIYHLPNDVIPRKAKIEVSQQRERRQPRHWNASEDSGHHGKDIAFETRRDVYRKQQYSMYVGTSPVSGYRNITPISFQQDDVLISRARMWIRRELAVFSFLNPDSTSFGHPDRRACNAEYLLEYIIAVLKVIDVKGSAGQAEELLQEFLGRQNTRLFLHELHNWLRSPYANLADWDGAVQYS